MKRSSSLVALSAISLILAACSSDASPASETTAASDTSVAAPQAIVSLSPSHTEILFAIGAGDQVIAVDDMSNYPAEALAKPHDLSGYEPNVEAIAALEPDLVVIADDTKDLSGQLGALGITVWVGEAPQTFDEMYQQIDDLGVATGHADEAEALTVQMQTDIDAAVQAVPTVDNPITYYHELDNTLYSVTSETFIGQVYNSFGLVNVADDAEEGNDYPQLSAEFLVDANPDVIFLADTKCCGESVESVSTRPGWDAITAVANGDVFAIDDDIASRWGPRIVDFIEAVSAALVQVTAAS